MASGEWYPGWDSIFIQIRILLQIPLSTLGVLKLSLLIQLRACTMGVLISGFQIARTLFYTLKPQQEAQ